MKSHGFNTYQVILPAMLSLIPVATLGTEPVKTPKMKVNDGDAGFIALANLTQSTGQPKLGVGTIVNTKLWPASFVSKSDSETCTSTLIGPRVLITAAHCVGEAKKASITYTNGKVFTGTCSRYPEWSDKQPSADFALCHMDAPVKMPGLQYEFISLDKLKITKNQELVAGGYGCTDLETQTIEEPPLFRVGSLFVDKPPGSMFSWPNWIATRPGVAGSATFVCPGDSGGAVYIVRNSGARAVVAVISAVGAEKGQSNYMVSYLAAISSDAGTNFIGDWLKKTKAQVCGIDVGLVNCREN